MDKRRIYARRRADLHLIIFIIAIAFIIAAIFAISRTVSLIMMVIFFIALSKNPRLWYGFWRTLGITWRKVIGQYKKYENWNKGAKGEELVAEYLTKLGHSYKVFDDVKLADSNGNIDHIVVGETGIFALETKHYFGTIYCEGDNWSKKIRGEMRFFRSPSYQITKNAIKLKEFIESNTNLRKLWVNGVVVLSNNDCIVHIKNSKTPVVKLHQLISYINRQKSKLNNNEINAISSLLEKQIN